MGEDAERIRYLNTDLDLASPEDLTALAAALEARGLLRLHLAREDDGRWSASFEVDEQHDEPEGSIAAMLAAVESLPESLGGDWARCTQRELNVGYDCGGALGAFSQRLSSGLLARMAAAGISLGITLYPPPPAPG